MSSCAHLGRIRDGRCKGKGRITPEIEIEIEIDISPHPRPFNDLVNVI